MCAFPAQACQSLYSRQCSDQCVQALLRTCAHVGIKQVHQPASHLVGGSSSMCRPVTTSTEVFIWRLIVGHHQQKQTISMQVGCWYSATVRLHCSQRVITSSSPSLLPSSPPSPSMSCRQRQAGKPATKQAGGRAGGWASHEPHHQQGENSNNLQGWVGHCLRSHADRMSRLSCARKPFLTVRSGLC
jgi:hypothetical protein